MAEFRLPATNQTLDGFVVNSRGNRLAKISVSVEQPNSSRFTPSGKWFGETDSQGEFHLDGLPGGELTLMVYPPPPAANRRIKQMVRVKVRAGSKDVRLVLPDARTRLQGIEE